MSENFLDGQDINMKFANAAFGIGLSGTAIGWVMYTIPILQGLALVVAIVSGIYAIRVYRLRKALLLKKLKGDDPK